MINESGAIDIDKLIQGLKEIGCDTTELEAFVQSIAEGSDEVQ